MAKKTLKTLVKEEISRRNRKAAKARAASLTPERRREIARNAVQARWKKAGT